MEQNEADDHGKAYKPVIFSEIHQKDLYDEQIYVLRLFWLWCGECFGTGDQKWMQENQMTLTQ